MSKNLRKFVNNLLTASEFATLGADAPLAEGSKELIKTGNPVKALEVGGIDFAGQQLGNLAATGVTDAATAALAPQLGTAAGAAQAGQAALLGNATQDLGAVNSIASGVGSVAGNLAGSGIEAGGKDILGLNPTPSASPVAGGTATVSTPKPGNGAPAAAGPGVGGSSITTRPQIYPWVGGGTGGNPGGGKATGDQLAGNQNNQQGAF